jgi:peptide/nickel transport system permease protein
MLRMTRSAVIDVLSSPAIEMAILKGVPRRRLLIKHALPNAIGPIVNVIALNLA